MDHILKYMAMPNLEASPKALEKNTKEEGHEAKNRKYSWMYKYCALWQMTTKA